MANVQDQKNQAREYVKLTQTNEVRLAALVIMKDEQKGKQKVSRENLPMVDGAGEPICYPSRYNVKLSFQGGEMTIQVKPEQFATIQEGEMYLFKGRLGLVREFGEEKIGTVFSSIELI